MMHIPFGAPQLHILLIWLLVLAGLFSGSALGLFFHRQGFLGGYQSWERRLCRLGHIACFGMAFLNGLFVLTLLTLEGGAAMARAALVLPSAALVAGSLLMPTLCFVSAFKRPLRHLFAVPVLLIAMTALSVVARLC